MFGDGYIMALRVMCNLYSVFRAAVVHASGNAFILSRDIAIVVLWVALMNIALLCYVCSHWVALTQGQGLWNGDGITKHEAYKC